MLHSAASERSYFSLLQGAYQVVDEMHGLQPELLKDQYWDQAQFQIPYTVAAQQYKKEALDGTADSIV
jgi:hypothetical protein